MVRRVDYLVDGDAWRSIPQLMGIDLQQWQGKRAGPLRCGWRSFIVWAPFFSLILISVWVQNASSWAATRQAFGFTGFHGGWRSSIWLPAASLR